MNCFKRFGEKVMARTFERQVAEFNIRASTLNRFTELGTPKTVAPAYLLLGLGALDLWPIYAAKPFITYGENSS